MERINNFIGAIKRLRGRQEVPARMIVDPEAIAGQRAELEMLVDSVGESIAESAHPGEGGRMPVYRRIINPVAEPDVARLEAFLYPGVVSGEVHTTLSDGSIEILDFEHRDQFGNPTRRIAPKEDK